MSNPITIILPDGSKREFDGPTTGGAIAASIGTGLAKAAIAVRVDGDLVDLDRTIAADAAIEIVTKKSDDETVHDLIRHDCAHVLAQAVQDLFPGVQVTIGPSIDNGFYYDFARDEPFTPDDFPAIEKRMAEIVDGGAAFARAEWDRDEAIAFFEQKGEAYKAELIRDLPTNEVISIYRQGDWLDLCRGPHMPSTKHVGKAFKLMKVAGAYWRGDHRNAMLQRIYGTAWRDEKELKAYLHQLEEAEKRDHRKLGKEMNLFHIQEEAVGSVFWHPAGWTLYRELERYIRAKLDKAGYREVKTPQLVDRTLWEKSGHWEKFREAMFVAEVDEGAAAVNADEGEDAHRSGCGHDHGGHDDGRIKHLALKPMNCPGHVQIFRQGLKSYRDLPLRLAEFGACHRYEPSGALHGIMRVRAFTQDDAHIFCTPEQIKDETASFIDLLSAVYRDLGFERFAVKFSDRPAVRAGSDETWDRAEAALRDAVAGLGLDYALNPGEGAFYGPKLEFVLRDAIGRDWQCGTLQVDFVLPERLDASYMDMDGERKRPVMLHRAILGSFERFIGILIENYAGKFPLWLAPTQVVVAPIVNEVDGYAEAVRERFAAAGLRATSDLRNEKINYKIREHSIAKTPIIAVVGAKEAAESKVTLRRLGDKAQETLALAEAVSTLVQEAQPPAA